MRAVNSRAGKPPFPHKDTGENEFLEMALNLIISVASSMEAFAVNVYKAAIFSLCKIRLC